MTKELLGLVIKMGRKLSKLIKVEKLKSMGLEFGYTSDYRSGVFTFYLNNNPIADCEITDDDEIVPFFRIYEDQETEIELLLVGLDFEAGGFK